MRLQSIELLRAFVGPEANKKMSQRKLARYAGVHDSFINHLTSGRRTSCTPAVARRIAEALEVPLEVLFVPSTSSNGQIHGKQKETAA